MDAAPLIPPGSLALFTEAHPPARDLTIAALLLALAVVILSPAAAAAARFFDVPGYVGGGGQYGSVASGNPSLDGARGPGFQVVFGRRLRDRHPLYFDLRVAGVFVNVGPTPEISYPADRADYAVMALGGLYQFRRLRSRGPVPWVSLHGSYHNFNWHRAYYSIEGLGLSPALGLDVRLRPLGLFRVGLTTSFFSATSLYDAEASGQSMHVTLDYLFAFGPRDER